MSDTDIFTIGEEYTSENGFKWVCISKSGEFAWLKDTGIQSSPAYVWNLNGTNVSQSTSWGYKIKPEPVVETVEMHGGIHDLRGFWCFGADRREQFDTHRITFTTKDGEPATGVFRNEDGDSIKMERI